MRGHGAWRAGPFALGVAARAVIMAGLAFGAVELAVRAHYYATALIMVGVAGVVAADLARAAGAADRILKGFVDGLTAGSVERPARPPRAFGSLSSAISRAADALETERRESHRRIDALEALLDTVSAALFVLKPDGSIVQSNRAARGLAGEAADRLASIPCVGPDTAARMMALGPGGREILRLADGRRMLAAAAAFSLPDGERRVLISLQSLAGELDLVELKAWQDLVRILAHEMMNSLTPIVSLAESLEGLLADHGEAASAVQVIARRSVGLMSFVDRYRRVAELPQPELAPVALAELAASLGRLIAPMLAGRGIAYRSEVDPPGLTHMADAELLEQAVLNLLKNAVDAVQDAPEPAIQLICRARPDGFVMISVADNGRGLPEDPEGLFVPFFTTKPGGSGIGLSIARQVALAHQGRVLAERQDNGGAVVSLVFPGPPSD